MESFYEDDIDIIGADDNGHCANTGPLIPKFYVGTSALSHSSASHLALQKAYNDLKKRYNDLAQRPRERAAKAYMRDVDLVDRSREVLMDDYQDMPSMAQAAGAEMPEMSSEQMKSQLVYNSYFRRKFMQETLRLQRFEVENKSLKDKLVDIECKYKTCLRDQNHLQQDFEAISQKVEVEKALQCEKSNSDEQLVLGLKNETIALLSELHLAKQKIFENQKAIADLSKKLESSETQLMDKIMEQRSNQQRDSHELSRTRELLLEREQEVSEMRKEWSHFMANMNQKNQNSIEKSKMASNSGLTSVSRSALEGMSIRQMNQNEGIIKKLQSETHQQAKLIQKLIERVTEKQNLISMEPLSRREIPGTSYVTTASPLVQIPIITDTGFSKHHVSPLQTEITGKDTKMECSVSGYVSQRSVMLGGGQKPLPVKSGISELMHPVHSSIATNGKALTGNDILSVNQADSCLTYHNGLVSFNIGSSGMTENTEMANPHLTSARNSEILKISDANNAKLCIIQNHQKLASSGTMPLGTRQPIETTNAGSYDNFDGSVSFNIGSSGMTENTEMANPHLTSARNSEILKISDANNAKLCITQNHQKLASSGTMPLGTRRPIETTNAISYDNCENVYNVIPDLKNSKRSDILSPVTSTTGLNYGSLFEVSTHRTYSEVFSTEHTGKIVPVQTELKHHQICPVCSQDFSDLQMEAFQTHVFDCFDNEADPPETLRLQEESNQRKCPMCESVFLENAVPQDEFEKHVQSHFGEDAITDRFEILRP